MSLFGKSKNRKWQQRPQLYKGKYFYIRRVMQTSLVVLVVLLFVALGMYFNNSDTLSIKKIEVLGDLVHLSQNDVIVLSELKLGDKLFTARLSRIQENIGRFSWIKDVRVRRKFPDTIQIHITERQPLAMLLAKKFYLVDKEGKIFKVLEKNDPQDLPVISGFEEEFVQNYQQLTKIYFNQTVSLLKFLQQQPFYNEDPVSEIIFDSVYGFSVYTQKRGLEIYYGKNNFVRKQQSLEKFKLSKYYDDMRYVRLDLDRIGRVVARKGQDRITLSELSRN